jgi:trk system potassium uptake protein TrkH
LISTPSEDLKIVGYHLARFSRLVSFLILPPLVVAILYSEFNLVPSFLLSFSLSSLICTSLEYLCATEKELELKHALLVAALLWLMAPLFGSLPLWFSGEYESFLDAFFESTSGFTGTGLTLTTRADLLPKSINFLRHLLQFVGDGVGIVVISLCIFGRTQMGSFLLFRGEAREAGIRPSIVRTSRRILGIAVTFLMLGTVLFTLAGVREGQEIKDAVFDGLNHSMTAYATGGFSTHSQNLLYYHSFLIEVVALILMILGSLNFNLHYAVLTGRRGEILKDIEIRFFIVSLLTGTVLTCFYLSHSLYPNALATFRKGFFQLISAQTTTGFQTVPASYIMYLWPVPVLVVLSAFMIMGGSANSTSGGIKNLRIGILFKSLLLEIKKTFLPSSAVVAETYHHLGSNPITETVIRGAAIVVISYLLLLSVGTLVTASFGYPLEASLFESASALANTGLSCGITSPSMPAALKLTYIFLMWAGRLEIITALILLSYILLCIRRVLP